MPVLLAPLRREWDEVKRRCEEELWPKVIKASRDATKKASGKAAPQRKAFDRAILDFVERLAHVTVLDPACGSGNFLYVAINMLLDLEKEMITYAADRGLHAGAEGQPHAASRAGDQPLRPAACPGGDLDRLSSELPNNRDS